MELREIVSTEENAPNKSNIQPNNSLKMDISSSFNLKDLNNKSFKLNNNEPDIYIITLLPINKERYREMLVQCIICNYKSIIKNLIKKVINNKVLNFIIDNNLSFSILDSKSFKDLFNFLKPDFTINRYKIKTILKAFFKSSLIDFNNELHITRDNTANNNKFLKAF
ncbi:hypothetical protein HD806DRAFT_527839 [Xylariaceae sp. AK1471]|nr:hypothetical protein HD806DRAFT_527839 [Xylariaceae sp. AK1471]